VGTFIGSMMSHLWVYEGALDATEQVLTLETEGPGMAADGTMAKYRDVIVNDDHRVMTSHVLSDDGRWHAFMTANYRRKEVTVCGDTPRVGRDALKEQTAMGAKSGALAKPFETKAREAASGQPLGHFTGPLLGEMMKMMKGQAR
jgi:hypothetical protein